MTVDSSTLGANLVVASATPERLITKGIIGTAKQPSLPFIIMIVKSLNHEDASAPLRNSLNYRCFKESKVLAS